MLTEQNNGIRATQKENGGMTICFEEATIAVAWRDFEGL